MLLGVLDSNSLQSEIRNLGCGESLTKNINVCNFIFLYLFSNISFTADQSQELLLMHTPVIYLSARCFFPISRTTIYGSCRAMECAKCIHSTSIHGMGGSQRFDSRSAVYNIKFIKDSGSSSLFGLQLKIG